MAQSLPVMNFNLGPQKIAYIERYNRTVMYGLLNQYLFKNLEEIHDSTIRWL